jgi:hypothetical protein
MPNMSKKIDLPSPKTFRVAPFVKNLVKERKNELCWVGNAKESIEINHLEKRIDRIMAKAANGSTYTEEYVGCDKISSSTHTLLQETINALSAKFGKQNEGISFAFYHPGETNHIRRGSSPGLGAHFAEISSDH